MIVCSIELLDLDVTPGRPSRPDPAGGGGGAVWRGWPEEPPSARQVWGRQTFCSPIVLQSFFRRWWRGKLERNPIGWLEQRTWSSRLVTWGWLAVMVSYLSAVLGQLQFLIRDFLVAQAPIGFLLAGSMALAAAGSFRRERETGALELIWVTPLTVRQIVGGRLRGLWGQFLPAVVLFLGAWLYMARALAQSGFGEEGWTTQLDRAGFFLSVFGTLPVIGLYCSLRFRQFLSALVGTLLLGLALPIVVAIAVPFTWESWGYRWIFNHLGYAFRTSWLIE